jgi:CheY-like chemotaxis protein
MRHTAMAWCVLGLVGCSAQPRSTPPLRSIDAPQAYLGLERRSFGSTTFAFAVPPQARRLEVELAQPLRGARIDADAIAGGRTFPQCEIAALAERSRAWTGTCRTSNASSSLSTNTSESVQWFAAGSFRLPRPSKPAKFIRATLLMARILVIDDDPALLDVLTLALEGAGHLARSARDGAEGLVLLRKEAPGVVVSDVNMPAMDGFSLCRKLRGEGNRVPIILLTSRDTEIDEALGLELGADDYVTKPFSTRVLLAPDRLIAPAPGAPWRAALIRRRAIDGGKA